MEAKKKKLLADGALIIAALIWGGDYVAVKLSLEELSPLFIIGVRFGAATLIMLPMFWKRIRRMGRKEVVAGLIVGVSLFAGFAFQTIALQYTTAGKSAFITSIYAIVLPFLAWILYKKFPGWYVMAGAAVCVLGVAFLSMDEMAGISIGDLLTVFCALFFAVNILAIAHYVKTVDPFVITVLETGVTAVLALAGAFIFERPLAVPGTTSLIGLIYLITLGTIGTHLLSNIALKHTPSVHAGIIFTTESVFAVIFAYFIIGEMLDKRMIIGCVLIFAAILIAEMGGPAIEWCKKKVKKRGR